MVQTYALVFHALAFVGAYAQIQWAVIDGALTHISVGISGVWGVNSAGQIFYRLGTAWNRFSSGTDWVQVPGELKQLDVGWNQVWGVSRNDEIWSRSGIFSNNPQGNYWVKMNGLLKHVSVSNNGHVWGVNSADAIYHYSDGNFHQVEGALKQISVGESGVWGVNSRDEIYYRTGTYGDNGSRGTGWEKVSRFHSRLITDR